ncbi:MAG TPA: hypothetical protein VLV86_18050, partial [Vicinamibacterales bacterium]|nr:hypothetical protein [Vicinamibacterales bacterium]
MLAAILYLLFFLSGVSGLVYQVVWVRAFGTVFGNTVYSSSIVVAIFMLGLGVGGYVAGRWSDRRYTTAPDSLLRAYGCAELLIAVMALGVCLSVPSLGPIAARSSSYVADARGWFVLSPFSYLARGAIAFGLVGPVAFVMGATLTLLVRHLVRRDVESAGAWKIALLYGLNTLGAATGAFLTDYLLVPSSGLRATQLAAVALNVVAGVGALALAHRRQTSPAVRSNTRSAAIPPSGSPATIVWTCVALTMSGFAAMGMEIVWLRHFTLLLGSFRAVFSLVMTVVLVGIGAGALVGPVFARLAARPAEALMALLAFFVCAVLSGLAFARFPVAETRSALTAWSWTDDLWHNLRPILLEAGVPCFLIGCSYPLGNAVIQHAEATVGRRAGALYLANTLGAVVGSLIAGFVLLPMLGMQGSASVLMLAAGLAIVPLAFTIPASRAKSVLAAASLMVVVSALGAWLRLPPDYVVRQAMAPRFAGERSLALSEGVNETIEVREAPGRGRGLLTNGHPMSSTAWLDQRYMRALAHVPLLSLDH